jgi:DNA-binding MarR family transcriptional regulator
VRSLSLQLGRLNEAVGGHLGLRGVDLILLDLVMTSGSMSPSEISAATGMHPATLTGLLDRLEQSGWVARQADPADRRRVLVEPVPDRGPDVVRGYGPMLRSLHELCRDYSAEELEVILDFLRRATAAGESAGAVLRDTRPRHA